MASNLKNKFSEPSKSQLNEASPGHYDVPKLSKAQLNQLAKDLPSWLRCNPSPKQLPGVYLGVLGQVQLQSEFTSLETKLSNSLNSLKFNRSQSDYMNRFTDTDRVHQLLSASRLSNETLATIWAHVNKTFPGRLTNREVCLALALIAIFQNIDDTSIEGRIKNPFELVKTQKKPPLPKLYPQSNSFDNNRVTTTKSIPDDLNNTITLIDIGDSSYSTSLHTSYSNNDILQPKHNSINLIDNLYDDHRGILSYRVSIWSKYMKAIRGVFKRTYDILMVENGRQSSLEAMKSTPGHAFMHCICLCYPMMHNIECRINELSKEMNSLEIKEFVSPFCLQMDDLVMNIKEYWAVLINLFHEAGQTSLIEIIMDGLSSKNSELANMVTIADLATKLDSTNRPDVCSICLTDIYLRYNEHHNQAKLSDSFSEDMNRCISRDNVYYYHAKCANFWLNYVDVNCLPYVSRETELSKILNPISL